jgi:hypothetical protein
MSRRAGTHERDHSGKSTGGNADSPAIVRAGRIIDVDPLRWTCIVKTDGGGLDNLEIYRDIPLGGMYLHPLNGEGVYVMPEAGALVWICKPSEGDAAWTIMSYRPYATRAVTTSTSPNKPVASSNRPRLSPGDLAFLGRDQNGLFVRRGQLTEIFGGPLARTLYQGRTGTIHSLAQVMKLDVFGGSVRWDVDRPELDPDGHQGTRVDLKAKEFADDRAHVSRVQIGKFTSDTTISEPVLRVQVFSSGDAEEAALVQASSLAANKSGEVELTTTGNVTVDVVAGGAAVASVHVSKDGTISITGTAAVTVQGTSVTLIAGSMQMAVAGAGVAVGAEAGVKTKVMKDLSFSTDAAAAWAEVVALCTALGLPSTNIAKHIASLGAAAYTSTALETE